MRVARATSSRIECGAHQLSLAQCAPPTYRRDVTTGISRVPWKTGHRGVGFPEARPAGSRDGSARCRSRPHAALRNLRP